jgi:hypothetical protein
MEESCPYWVRLSTRTDPQLGRHPAHFRGFRNQENSIGRLMGNRGSSGEKYRFDIPISGVLWDGDSKALMLRMKHI